MERLHEMIREIAERHHAPETRHIGKDDFDLLMKAADLLEVVGSLRRWTVEVELTIGEAAGDPGEWPWPELLRIGQYESVVATSSRRSG